MNDADQDDDEMDAEGSVEVSEADSELSESELDKLLASPSPIAEDGSGDQVVIEDSPLRGSQSAEALELDTASEAIEADAVELGTASQAIEADAVELGTVRDKDAAMVVEDSPLKTPAKCLAAELEAVETPPPSQRFLSTTSLDSTEDSQAARPRRSPRSTNKEPVFKGCKCEKPDGECVCAEPRLLKKKIAALKMEMAARSHPHVHDFWPVDSYTTAYP